MRKLIYVPIIHISADFGEIASEVNKRGLLSFGKEEWKRHKEAILGFWDSIAHYFDSLEAKDIKIYQDGLVAGGDVGEKIVSDGVKKGSKNYEIVSKLISRGAHLEKTENFLLVKKEYDYILKLAKARKVIKKVIAALNYRFHKNKLLRERDEFIAKTIDSTLGQGETGILFLGAQHEILSKLPEDIEILRLINRERINEYRKKFLFKKDKEKLDQLAEYLASPIE
ncbi:MAG: hypothetical protein ISS41_08750 [Candidatus Aminicenantes bacterium]|nr:hypothetical protein [Candidatus Aminicenantes bacterium]MBL7083703.1 hypothetical protein [Candidatus Aminicenantes bacterium]